ncbi:hypothetical protein CN958_23835 [Bacillus cereus]|uniref:Uncharacterized protein n=1 Tax=Bacillus cereus TaxID=1396 RepID=A0A2B9DP64_BACCE|nr:hypothetical protein CN958_23835 [Bacillus cereus]
MDTILVSVFIIRRIVTIFDASCLVKNRGTGKENDSDSWVPVLIRKIEKGLRKSHCIQKDFCAKL